MERRPCRSHTPPIVSDLHPSIKLRCWKRVRNASKQGPSTAARKRLRLERWGRHLRPNKAMNAVSRVSNAFKEIGERLLSTDGIPYQEREEIDRFIGSEASPYQTYPARVKACRRPFVVM